MNKSYPTKLLQLTILLVVALALALESIALSLPSFASDLTCRQVPELIFRIYLSNHYSQKQLSEEIKQRTVDQFIKSLDPTKTLLLESDVSRLKQDLPKLFQSMSKNDCQEIEKVFEFASQRLLSIETFVRSYLGPQYKLDESVEFILNPDKRSYAKTKEENENLIKTLVHFQVSNSLLTEKSLDKVKKQIIHRYELSTKRFKDHKMNALITSFAESFARALDPHTSYMPEDEMKEFQIYMRLSLEGIGVSLSSEDGYITVQEIIPGGSADRAKALKPKDKIMAVAQETGPFTQLFEVELRDAVKLIRGKKGTKVRLSILRQGDKTETQEITLVRDKIDMKDQAAQMEIFQRKADNGKTVKVAYIDLPSFYGGGKGERSCFEDMRKLVLQAKQEKVDGMVLDLSRNGGGLLTDAVRIAGLFIRKGSIVATQDYARRTDTLADENPQTEYTGPLLVLTSRVSASASEILAGALKDYRRALIVGSNHTFGKGTVQIFNPLSIQPQNPLFKMLFADGADGDLGGMKITTGMFFLPKGVSTQHRGVESDIILPSPYATDDVGEKTLEYALAASTIPSFISQEANASPGTPDYWLEVNDPLIQALANHSKVRIQKEPKFQEVLKELAEAEKNKGVVKLADLRKKSEADKKKNDKEKRDTIAERRKLMIESPQVQEALNIMADWAGGVAKN